MWKAIVAGAAALAIAGGSLALAHPRWGRDGGQRWQPSTEDLRAFGEARLAALKAGLALTPEQERAWPAFEQAARELGRLRIERRAAARDASRPGDPVERLRQRATALSDTGAALRKLAETADPLYNSLDEAQKRRFNVLSRIAGHVRHHLRGGEDRFRGREFRGRSYDGARHHWRRGDMMDREPSGRRGL
jgi:hypothetical protein